MGLISQCHKTNYLIIMYIVCELREQQKKAVNHYEKCCFLFFIGIFKETLSKLLRKCCLFIWYQNRPFKIMFEVIFVRFVQFNSHLQKTIMFEVIFVRFVQFNSHLQKTSINYIAQSCNFKTAPFAF